MPRKEPLYPHVPKSREPVYPRTSPPMRAAKPGLKEEVWVYAKVGTTEVRGRRDPTGIQFEQVSPTYNLSDFDKAVKIIEEKLKGDVASTIPTKPCPKCGKPLRLRYFSKTKEYSWGHEYSISDIMSFKSICDYSEKAKPEDVASTEPIKPSPIGTCYPDAWRFLMRQGEGYLVHGSVQLSAEGARVKHAWVELPTGYVWEPQTKQYFTVEDFRISSPIEEHRYTAEQAAIMVARTRKHGPWTDEEVLNYLKRKVPPTIHSGSEGEQLSAATMKIPFVKVGERVRLVLDRKGKFRYGHWPEGVWLGDQAITGTVTEYHPEQPAVRVGGKYFEALEAWAVVKWDNGADTAIHADGEGKRWIRVKMAPLLV